MAVLTMSAAVQLLATSGTVTTETAGETIAENDLLFKVTSSGTGVVGSVKKLVNTSVEAATVYGIALQGSKDTGELQVLRPGGFFEMASSTFTAGQAYVASATAGKVQLASDNGTGDFYCLVGGAYDVDQFRFIGTYIGEIP